MVDINLKLLVELLDTIPFLLLLLSLVGNKKDQVLVKS